MDPTGEVAVIWGNCVGSKDVLNLNRHWEMWRFCFRMVGVGIGAFYVCVCLLGLTVTIQTLWLFCVFVCVGDWVGPRLDKRFGKERRAANMFWTWSSCFFCTRSVPTRYFLLTNDSFLILWSFLCSTLANLWLNLWDLQIQRKIYKS